VAAAARLGHPLGRAPEQEDSMGFLLAVLVLAAIGIGFTLLMVLPLVFMWLGIAVFKEPWKTEAPAVAPEREPVAPVVPPPPPEVERPRVMVAGRRRPL
jgi:hypothetical protein